MREENIHALKRNGKIFFINAEHDRLIPTDDRPLSDTAEKMKKLYEERIDIYKNTSDVIVPDMETPEAEAEFILNARTEMIK